MTPLPRAAFLVAVSAAPLAGPAARVAVAAIDFAPPVTYPLGGWGRGVLLEDVDADGDRDLVVGTYPINSGRISVFLNDGAGSFGGPSIVPAGGDPTGLGSADVDGDGRPDVVASLFSPASAAAVFRNDGAGGFLAPQTYSSGNATWIAAGDLDGDGWPDLATANSEIGTPHVSVFLNRGDGTFAPRVDYPAAGGPRHVVMSDVDRDGDADLVVTATFSSVVSVFVNRGDGTFGPRVDYPTGVGPWFVFAGDLDGDGWPDLAVANAGTGPGSDVSVLFNAGDGTFGAQAAVGIFFDARGITGADFDGDGDLDLAVVISPRAIVSVLENDGSGGFAPPVHFSDGPGSTSFAIAAGDVNGDGRPDLVTTSVLDEYAGVLINQSPVATSAGGRPASSFPALVIAPNPANPADGPVALRYRLEASSAVELVLYDLQGRRVATLVSGARPAGAHVASWDVSLPSGGRAPAGVYFVKLRAGRGSAAEKLVLAR